MRTALILGASGLVGRFCLNALLEDPEYQKVVSIGRRELAVASPKLMQKILDLGTLAAVDLPLLDDVFCALGTTIRKAGSQDEFRRIDMGFPLAAARQALKSGAKQFVLVSSVGADPKSKSFYLRTKGELEEAVAGLPFQAVQILRPSLLIGQRAESRPGESFAMGASKVLQFLCVGPLRRYHPITALKVAQAMVAVAKSGRVCRNVYEYSEMIAAN